MKRFLKEYKIEIISILLVLVGLIMMMDFSIRGKLLSVLKTSGKALSMFIGKFPDWLGVHTAAMTPGDFFGGLLVVFAMGFIVWRVRYRFKNDPHWSLELCPKCSNPITRVHRNLWDRILGATILPDARRYRCVNQHCNWSGLLHRHVHRHRRSHSEQAVRQQNLQ